MSTSTVPTLALLDDFSLEITGKDAPALETTKHLIPPGAQINVTFLGNEDLDDRVAAAAAVREHGFRPVPHVSARRLRSEAQLREFLERLRQVEATEAVFAVGGDPHVPEGPYEDSLALIRSGLFEEYGVRHVSIAGYPGGHPDISDDALWAALDEKVAALDQQGFCTSLVTQLGFDASAVLSWIGAVRKRGVDVPVRVGVPGPAGVKRLLSFARRCGIGSSAGIAKKYGFSLTNLMGTAGPDRFITDLAAGLDEQCAGQVSLHFYTFGGVRAMSEWAHSFREARTS